MKNAIAIGFLTLILSGCAKNSEYSQFESSGSDQTYVCRDEGDTFEPAFFSGHTELFKVQNPTHYKTYDACQADIKKYFGDAKVCSIAVASTVNGCMPTASGEFVAEMDFAVPVLLNGKALLPYSYFLNDLSNCYLTRDFVNSYSDRIAETVGSFTQNTTKLVAECVDQRTLRIRLLGK